MTIQKDIDYYRNCNFIISIFLKELCEIDSELKLMNQRMLCISDKALREDSKNSIDKALKIRKDTIRIIDNNNKALEEFKKILAIYKDGQCKQYLIDYVLNNMSNAAILEKYLYTDPASVNQLKKRAIDKWKVTVKAYYFNAAGKGKDKRVIA